MALIVIIGIGFLSVSATWISIGTIIAMETNPPSIHQGMYGKFIWNITIEINKKNKNEAIIEYRGNFFIIIGVMSNVPIIIPTEIDVISVVIFENVYN